MISFGIYLLFTISYFIHLPSRIPFLGTVRMEILLGLALLISVTMSGKLSKAWATKSPVFRRLVWLLIFIVISIPFVKWPGSVIRNNLSVYLKAVFFFIISISLIDSEKRLKIFLSVFIGCQLIRIFEPLYLHITIGYWGDITYSHFDGDLDSLNRLSGAPNDIVNANQYAWLIVSIVPFVYYLGLKSKKILFVAVSILLYGAMGYSLMLTGSRSGLICLMVVIFTIALLGEGRIKRMTYTAILLIPFGVYLVGTMNEDMLTRYRSLFDHSVVGGDTAEGRINGVERNLETVSEEPQLILFGHGVGTSREANYYYHGGKGQVTHNLYVEIIQEIGLIGFVLFLMYIKSFGNVIFRVYKSVVGGDSVFMTNLVQATSVWFVMNLVYSLSCFGLSSWEWYLFGGITHICWVLGHAYAKTEYAVTTTSD